MFNCFFIHHSTHPRIVPRGDCKMYSVPGATQPNLAPEIEIKVYTLLLLLLRILVLNIQQLFFAVLFYLQKKNSQGVLGFRLNTVEKKVFYQLFVFFIFKPWITKRLFCCWSLNPVPTKGNPGKAKHPKSFMVILSLRLKILYWKYPYKATCYLYLFLNG